MTNSKQKAVQNPATLAAAFTGGLTRGFLWRQRIGYGAADFACNLIWQMISLYLLYYYTDVAHLNGGAIALMFVVCRVIDGITDLLIGWAIDRTHTRWGNPGPGFCGVRFPLPFSLISRSRSRNPWTRGQS